MIWVLITVIMIIVVAVPKGLLLTVTLSLAFAATRGYRPARGDGVRGQSRHAQIVDVIGLLTSILTVPELHPVQRHR